MKKMMVLGAAMCVALSFTGCKSSESAYKKAYEKAKAQEQTSTDNDDSNKRKLLLLLLLRLCSSL